MAEAFVWSRQGLNVHHFMAFGNLLALRNGGQVEPTLLREGQLQEEESDNDSDSESIDTSRPQPISNSGHNVLKRKFLNYLAKFIANKKGRQSVACSAMKEAEDRVTIWVTRNEGFQDLATRRKYLSIWLSISARYLAVLEAKQENPRAFSGTSC